MEEKLTTTDLFGHVFDLSPQSITITSLYDGVYMEVNSAFEKVTGYTKEEVIGKTVHEIEIWVDPDFRKKYIQQLSEKKEVKNLESQFRRKNGAIGYTLITAKIISFNGEACIVAFFEDLTLQKEKDYEYQQTINNLPLGIFKSTVNGQVLSANTAMCKIYGFDSVEEILNQAAADFYSEKKDRKKMLQKLEEEGTLLNYETLEQKNDGSKIWVSTNYKAIYDQENKLKFIEGIIEDITQRKQYEKAFIESRRLLFSFLDSHPDIMFLKDDEFKYIIANTNLVEFTGKSIDKIIDHTDYDIFEKQVADNCRLSDLKTFDSNELVVSEEQIRGDIFETIKFPVTINGQQSWLGGIVRNVTERRKMENSLRESEERFRELFQNNNTVLLLIDPDTGHIVDGNRAALKFYNYSKKKLQSLHYSDITVSLNKAFNIELCDIKNKKGSHFTGQHRLGNKELRNVEVYTGFINTEKRELIYAFVYDITEQIIARKKIEIFNKAIDQSFSGIVITDKDGTIEFVNPAFTRISGYSQEEAIGQNPRILKSGVQTKKTYEELWNTILSGKSWTGELANKRKDDRIYWEKATISPIVDQNGNITHFVAIKDDITQQKQLIQDLLVAKNKAEESNKLKSAFLSNMSHEIRTPLNSIIGFADLLIDEDSKEQQEEFKKYIIESSDQLLSVVNDVLDMSLITTQQIIIFNEKFDINTFVTEVITHYLKSIQLKGLKLNIVKPLENGICQIYSDFSRLKQIIEKLFNNALKYTQEGEITFGYDFVGGKIRFFIKDTGIGIPEDKQNRIYESFSQGTNELNRKYGGLGLGLTIAKRISELISAEINFESVHGEGSTFYVILPKENFQLLSVSLKPEQEINISDVLSEPVKIMIVEDDISNFEYLKTILMKSGLKIIHVKNGDEVLPCYKKNEDIQLVIMDIRLPQMDGWQATKLLKEYDPQLPVIVLTAFAAEGDMQRAQIANADMFLTKPTRPEVLLKHIVSLTQGL